MAPDVEQLILSYRNKGALIDTNLMVLWAVGNYLPQRIATHKRTSSYSVADYERLLVVVNNFSRRLTTPNILTEVHNLARQLPEAEYRQISEALAQLMVSAVELFIPSAPIAGHQHYVQMGLTDAGILSCPEDFLLITDDFRLWGIFQNAGRPAINMNHLRPI